MLFGTSYAIVTFVSTMPTRFMLLFSGEKRKPKESYLSQGVHNFPFLFMDKI